MQSTGGSSERYEKVRAEWLAITRHAAPSVDRYEQVKRESDALIDAGRWTSGPSDMLSVLGRQRDELSHSRMIGWLLVPTGRHRLGRAFLKGFLDAGWPGEGLMATGSVSVETEVTAAGLDDDGRLHEARADIVIRGNDVTVVVENKLDAGEQVEQCERLYWAWAGDPGDVRWLFLTPTGRHPVTATSPGARAAWRTMSYSQVRDAVAHVVGASESAASPGRLTAMQYLSTLTGAVAP